MASPRHNMDGEPAADIPYPPGSFRLRCYCGRRFWRARAYRGHFALVHVLALPEGWDWGRK